MGTRSGDKGGNANLGVWAASPEAYRWLEDFLTVLEEYDIGWALWTFRGAFGPLDNGREGVQCEDLDGHQLDRAMLDILQAH